MADHPDLQIKTEVKFRNQIIHAISIDLCVKISLSSGGVDNLPTLPNVTAVVLNNVDLKSSLKNFPNMTELRIINMTLSQSNSNDLHLYMGNKVKSVDITLDEQHNLSIIESLINSRPLVELYVGLTLINRITLGSFIGMLINSRNNTLKKVKFEHILNIEGSRLKCRLNRDSFNLLPQLLNKFPKVTHLDLTIERSNLGDWSQVAQGILAADHRRSIMLNVVGKEDEFRVESEARERCLMRTKYRSSL